MSADRDHLPVEVVMARTFQPLHKRVLGVATGTVGGFLVFAVTALHVMTSPEEGIPLQLLAQYFYGYDVSWRGAFVGAWWGFFTGFVAGFFAAFVRNVAMATWLVAIRARAHLTETRDFLDHI